MTLFPPPPFAVHLNSVLGHKAKPLHVLFSLLCLFLKGRPAVATQGYWVLPTSWREAPGLFPASCKTDFLVICADFHSNFSTHSFSAS